MRARVSEVELSFRGANLGSNLSPVLLVLHPD